MKSSIAFLVLTTSIIFTIVEANSQEPIYISITELFPAQARYASQNVEEKIARKITKGDAQWNTIEERWEYRYDEGRSIFSPKKAIPVVKASFGYVLIDGHHDVLSSLALNATWIPVRIIADLSAFSEDDFWQKAEEQGFTYQYDLQGQYREPPYYFEQLEDDPNRYFASISARKYSGSKSTGAEYPLWIRVGKDSPFIEFKIADVLWQNNIVYSYDMGRDPPEDFVERARQALVAAQMPGVRVIAERTHYSEL